ncbi:MAG: HAD hydrolase family protein [Muribaculaceae bacterium]|nr:HAD hydrolase family protein [Muribaculaceae bacterium]
MSKINYDLSKIRGVAFDVDGVLSPATIPMADNGAPIRMANLKDGYAISRANKKGIKLAIISGADAQSIVGRFTLLGLKDIYLSVADKLPVLKQWMRDNDLNPEEVAYVGDDIPDLQALLYCGLPVAPRDAAVEVKSVAKYITGVEGGHGVARELLEEVLKAQDLWISNNNEYAW